MLHEKPETVKEPYILVIGPDRVQNYLSINKPPSVEVLQSAVGGHFETVPYFTKFEGRPCIAFCNEDGKMNRLPVNELAQQLWEKVYPQIAGYDILVGTIAIVVGSHDFLARM